jgi:hypothetical protein
MAFPQHHNNRFMQDIKVLFEKRPRVMSVGIAIMGVIAVGVGSQSLFRISGSFNETSPENLSMTESADGALLDDDGAIADESIEIESGIVDLNLELSDREALDDSAPSPDDQTSHNRHRSIESLFNPSDLAASISSARGAEGNHAASMYDDLFQPITLQDTSDISASVTSLLSTLTLPFNPTEQLSNTNPSNRFVSMDGSVRLFEPSEQDGSTIGSPIDNTPQQTTTNNTEALSSPFSFGTRQSNRLNANRLNADQPQALQQQESSRSGLSYGLGSDTSGASDGLSIQMSPPPGTTGYTLPSALRNPFNPYTQRINPQFAPAADAQVLSPSNLSTNLVPTTPFISPLSPFGTNPATISSPSLTPSFPSIQQPALTLPQNSFAVPASPPSTRTPRFNGGGRGGEFNTFSNP